ITMDPAALNAAPLGTNGNGAFIAISSFLGSINIVNGGIINASSVGFGDGGSININVAALVVTAAAPPVLAANGSGGRNGGNINVVTSGDLVAGNLGFSATGGSSGSISGDGGNVYLASLNGNLEVNPALLNVAPLGTNGNGGSIRLITSVDFGSV